MTAPPIIGASLYGLPLGVLIYFFWTKRHVHPINARLHGITIAANIAIYIYFIFEQLEYEEWNLWCGLYAFRFAVVVFYTSIIFIRAWNLYFRYRLNADRLHAMESLEFTSTWFMRHTHWIRNRYTLIVPGVLCSLNFLVYYDDLHNFGTCNRGDVHNGVFAATMSRQC